MTAQVLAVDFDGTLVRPGSGPHGLEALPGARDALLRLVRAEWRVIVHSARANYAGGHTVIQEVLDHFNIPYHEIVAKPHATVYLDDRGVHFDGWPGSLWAVTREGSKR